MKTTICYRSNMFGNENYLANCLKRVYEDKDEIYVGDLISPLNT